MFCGRDADGVSWHMTYKQRKVTEEWLDELSKAYEDDNVLEDECLTIPLEGPCLRTWDCPIDESTWCNASDPNVEACPNNVSPRQEPDVPMKSGAVAGLTILGLVASAAIGHFLWRKAMQRKKAKYQRQFVHRIAKEIKFNQRRSVGPSEHELLQAFKKIDVSEDGFIKKDELRAFLSSESMVGEGGESEKVISDSDLNALFAALDPKGRSKVNFLDFCTFLGVYNADEVMTEAELENEMEGCDDEERMERIVRRLSSRQLVAN